MSDKIWINENLCKPQTTFMLIQTDTGMYTKAICPWYKTLGYTSSQINSADVKTLKIVACHPQVY